MESASAGRLSSPGVGVSLLLLLLISVICPCTEACGWTSSSLSGTVQSPNFPSNYSSGQSCVFIIQAPAGYQITVNFTDFQLEPGTDCGFDYLEIRDGDDETSPRIGRYCNTSVPQLRRTFSNQMWIKFFSDGSLNFRGFRATYESAYLQAPFFLICSALPSYPLGGSIHRMDVETKTNIEVPMSETLNSPRGVDFDYVEQKIYWTQVQVHKGILRSDLNGSNVETILQTNTTSVVEGLAVDPLSRLIFYADSGTDTIGMLTISTFAHKTIFNTSIDLPRAIVLDTTKGEMFWTDWGQNEKIERANYDGSNRTALVTTGLYFPNALALDVSNNRLYWVDAGYERVEMLDLGDSTRTVLLSLTIPSPYHFFGLARLGNVLYITDWFPGSTKNQSLILKHEIGHKNASIYGVATIIRLYDIHVVTPAQQSPSVNGCGNNNGGCAVICVPLPNNSSKCLCPDGQSLASDGTSCGEESTTNLPSTTTSESSTTSTTTTPEPSTSTTTTPEPSTSTTTTTESSTSTTTTTESSTPTLPGFSVVVKTLQPQPFETNGNMAMTLICDPDVPVDVTSYVWSVPCESQTDNTCVFKPRPDAEDDGKTVTCTVTTSDGRFSSGAMQIELNYPPQSPPVIHGHSKGTVYQEGQSLTLTCSIPGGKPLVTKVHFSCGPHKDVSQDTVGTSEVHSVLSLKPVRAEDDGVTCVCTGEWKDTEWYKLSATIKLRVNGTRSTAEGLNAMPVAAGSAAAAVVVIAVIIIVVCVVVRRLRNSTYARPPKRQPSHQTREEHVYSVHHHQQQQQQQQQQHVEPGVHGPVFDNPSFDSDYATLVDIADCASGLKEDDYLHPGNSLKPPAPCQWGTENPASRGSGYIHAVSNPSHNDYTTMPKKI